MITRRHAAVSVGCALLAPSMHSLAATDSTYPHKPVTLIVPFAPGNVTDGIARLVGDSLGKALQQPIVIDNKVGASGIIGMSALKRAPADGYTLGLSAIGPMALNPSLYKNLAYEPLNDFKPIALIYRGPMFLLVDAKSDLRTLLDVIAFAKKSTDPLQYTTPGIGSSQHLTAELFAVSSDLKLQHIPSKGSPQAATMLLSGMVPVLFESATPAMSFIASGQMRAIAISTPKRTAEYPQVPTFVESGLKDVTSFGWLVVVAPAATPTLNVDRIAKALQGVMVQPSIVKALQAQGAEAVFMTPQASVAFIKSEQNKWGQLIRKLNLSLE